MRAHRRSCHLIAIVAIAAALPACKSVPMLPGLSPYQIDIQQGNVVTQDMIDKLKPGMTKQQVRFVMGSPPIVDPFHKDRWDYVYYLNKGGRVLEHRRLVLRFDGEVLKRVEGDVVVGSGDKGARPAAGIAKPSETVKPADAVKPAEAKPGDMVKPGETAKPSEIAKPAETAKPSEATPGEMAKPGEAAKPAEAANPGETTAADAQRTDRQATP